METIRLATLLTCYNRKEKTLACLKALYSQSIIENVEVDVYLVDDGCTDGTGDAVRSTFPEVKVLEGDGNLFWNGGMRLAFSEAVKKEYDFHLWLNDDTLLFPSFVRVAVDTWRKLKQEHGCEAIVVGSTQDRQTSDHTYGGVVRQSRWRPMRFTLLQPKDTLQPCDTFNGNCVLIPSVVFKAVGNLSIAFTKMMNGDYDYGFRAKTLGFPCWVAPGYSGTCSRNSLDGSIYDASVPIKKRLEMMHDPCCLAPIKEHLIFIRRHTGILWPICWLRAMVRFFFPRLWLFYRSRNMK